MSSWASLGNASSIRSRSFASSSRDGLGCLGRDEAEEREKDEPECAHRYALGRGDSGIEGGEEQRPRDRKQQRAGQNREHDGIPDIGGAEPEDGAEENPDAGGPVAGAVLGGEDRQEKDAETERPGEERADRDVVGAGLVPEDAHDDA